MTNKIATILGILAMLAGAFWWFMSYDAQLVKAGDLRSVQMSIQKLNQRLDLSALEQQRRDLQSRVWQFEDRYRKQPMPPHVLNEYRCLVRDLKATTDKINALKGK